MSKVLPVILSGGTGTRLWPISRAVYPKQFLELLGSRSLFQETVLRVSNEDRYESPYIVCNSDLRFLVVSQLAEIGGTPSCHILEPVGRNTAPAAAVAALLAQRQFPDSVLLLLPADHYMSEPEAFWTFVETGREQAENGSLVTFGIVPEGPETGYGYIKKGSAILTDRAFKVAQFKEKPDRAHAQAYIDEGGYYWNSGIFMFRADTFIEELETHDRNILTACESALEKSTKDLNFVRLDSSSLASAPPISIDYAVMEKTSRAVVVPATLGWSDIGSWSALWSVSDKDAAGNVISGDVIAHEVSNSYVRSENRLIAALGIENMIVIDSDDAVMVADLSRSEEVKTLVEQLKNANRDEYKVHVREYRPWGFFENIQSGKCYKVKQLCVNPGSRLSLQKHAKRSEHWVVVSGVAEVTIDGSVETLKEGESAFIPLGSEHRLANPGDEPLIVIEVQSGNYLGEDDIVRIEDDYNRLGDTNPTAQTLDARDQSSRKGNR